jgi:HEAT repeat protein
MKPLFLALLLLAGTAIAQESKLIAVLKSDASLNEKADACQELARIGTRESVPVLATLLADEQLSHRARLALSNRSPTHRSTPRCVRRWVRSKARCSSASSIVWASVKDPQAVEPLASLLKGSDPDGGAGRGAGAWAASEARLSRRSKARCQVSADHPAWRFAKACSGVPKPCPIPRPPLSTIVSAPAEPAAPLARRRLERGDPQPRPEGVPLLVEAIRTGSPVPAADAIRMSMDLPGAAVTQALVGALAEANEETQILLLQTLGDRGDATAAPALIALAQSGSASDASPRFKVWCNCALLRRSRCWPRWSRIPNRRWRARR